MYIDKATIRSLDLLRYMGKWYEIARITHRFERGLVGCTANYTINDNGTIKVVNSGYKNCIGGKFRQIEGVAKQPDSTKPGALKVSFFLWFYVNYLILELDEENYSYALIGSSSSDYLWILSRTPQLSDVNLKFLLQRVGERGYKSSKLYFTPQ
ncbi:MAG: lipocalin family protein [Bacteroidales bacterium]